MQSLLHCKVSKHEKPMNMFGMEEDVATDVLLAMANFKEENERCVMMSKRAYAAFEEFATTVTGRIFDLLCSRGQIGATDDEMEEALNILHQTVNPCRQLLHKEGWIKQNGKERPTRSGCSACVWIVCQFRLPVAVIPKIEGWALLHEGRLTGEIFTSEANAKLFVKNLHDSEYASLVTIIRMREVGRPKYVSENHS